MGDYRKYLKLLAALFLLHGLLPGVASSVTHRLQIKVLSAKLFALDPETSVPKDCDLENFSAYCNNSRTSTEQIIMLVQDDQGTSFNISCTKDSRWSKCAALPIGEIFEATIDKHGIMVVFRNSKGKEKKQLYQLVAMDPTLPPSAP
jgi:hypothetical protein